jgi:Tfp pilus assembly protein PilN
MIKINLLLTRKEKKKVGMRKEFIVLILSVVILFVVFILIQWKTGKEKDEILAQISQTKKEISYYKSLITEVNKAKESQKTLQDKIEHH